MTLVLCLVVSKLLVDVEGIGVCAYLGTNVANYWLLLVSETYVICQISLDLVLLVAAVTWEFELFAVLPSHVNLYLVLVLVAVITLIAVEHFHFPKAHCLVVHPLDVRDQGRFAFRLIPTFVAVEA